MSTPTVTIPLYFQMRQIQASPHIPTINGFPQYIHACCWLNVSDNNITVQFTYLYRNGTTDTTTKWVDVGTGASDSEAARGYFTALNATIFNVTSLRTYLGVSREAGHLCAGFQNGTFVWSYNGTEHRLLYNYTLDHYADKVTGTLLEYTETISNRNETYFSEMTFHVVITQSNITTDFRPNLISLLPVMAAPLLGLTARKRKRPSREHQTEKRAPTEPFVTEITITSRL